MSHTENQPVTYADYVEAQTGKALNPALTGLSLPDRKSETYRYTPLSQLKSKLFAPASNRQPAHAGPIADPILPDSLQLVFVDGILATDISQFGATAVLAPAGDSHPELDAAAAELWTSDSLASLSRRGAAQELVLRADTASTQTVELIYRSSGTNSRSFTPHVKVIVAENKNITIVERIQDTGHNWLNPTLKASVAPNGFLRHIRILTSGPDNLVSARAFVTVSEHASYEGVSLASGDGETRFDIAARLDGAGAAVRVNGVLLAGGKSAHELNSYVHHTTPDAVSDQIIRSIASDKGKATFQGKIRVEKGAQKTLADQSSRALLLDRTAEINSRPELEIFADDVKCSHGATVGELDKLALYYLVSRGVHPDTAKNMLVEAFTAGALTFLPPDIQAALAGFAAPQADAETRQTEELA